MMIEYVLLAQMAAITPPNIMNSETVPVYSWQRNSLPPVYQRPMTGIYSSSGGPNVKNFEEELNE